MLLGLRQEELAQRAGMAVGTINAAELGTKATRPLTLKILFQVLTEAGVEFLPEDDSFGPGVRLLEPSPVRQEESEEG